MNNQSSIGAIALTRFQALQAQHQAQRTAQSVVRQVQPDNQLAEEKTESQLAQPADATSPTTSDPTPKQPKADNITSIELPQAIKTLITGSDFWINAKTNRYKKLIREGHLNNLLELATLALTKKNPAHWFAKVCSVKAWERTLDFLKKLHTVQQKATQVATRLGTDIAERMSKFIYKQIWSGRSVERHAVAAQEIGKDRHKLFAWLCKREGEGRAPSPA